jgi:hypothetical protein
MCAMKGPKSHTRNDRNDTVRTGLYRSSCACILSRVEDRVPGTWICEAISRGWVQKSAPRSRDI